MTANLGDLVSQEAERLATELGTTERVWVSLISRQTNSVKLIGVYRSAESAKKRCDENYGGSIIWDIHPDQENAYVSPSLRNKNGDIVRYTVLPLTLKD